MSDYNSSLPVRTETNGDVAAKIVDGTITSQTLAVDSTGKIGITSDGPVTPGTVATTANLIAGQYNSTLPTLTNTQQAAVQVDSSGRLLVNTSGSEDRNYGTVGALTLRTAAQIGNATGGADFNAGATGAQTLRVEANQGTPNTTANAWPIKITDGTNTATVTATGELEVQIAQPLPSGSNTIGSVGVTNLPTTVDTNYGTVGASTIRTASQIGNATGAADFNNGATGAQTLRVAANLAIAGANVTALNPVPVTISQSNTGDEINDYNTGSAVAANATSTHDYTVTAGKTLQLTQVEASASGKMKIEVRVETGVATGVFNTKFVKFNSTATPNIELRIKAPIDVAAGVRVRVIRTNRDNQPQDLFSTICGQEV